MIKYINNKNKIPLINKFLSYFYPQKFIDYKDRSIYIKSSIFESDESFLYRYKVIEDTSSYKNHVYIFKDIGLYFNRKTSALTLSYVLTKINFNFSYDDTYTSIQANIGPTFVNNIIHKLYYKFLASIV